MLRRLSCFALALAFAASSVFSSAAWSADSFISGGEEYEPRSSSSSSWDYVDIHLVPSSSNMEIYTTNRPRVTVDDLLPYVSILLLGGLLVCCMRRSSS